MELCFLCRCGLQSECSRGNQPGQWLWSFEMEQQCLTIQDLTPSNVSRTERKMVHLQYSYTQQKKQIQIEDLWEDEDLFSESQTCFGFQ